MSIFDQMTFLTKIFAQILTPLILVLFILWLIKGRPKRLNIQLSYLTYSVTLSGLIIATGVLVINLIQISKDFYNTEKQINESRQLAIEIMECSEHLTYLAHLFVATKEVRYENYFNIVMDIRNGKQPHPKDNHAYLHKVFSGEIKFDQDGKKYSLEKRISELNYSKQEMEKLIFAISESNTLIQQEIIALNAMKGNFIDIEGKFTLKDRPDQKMARTILFGKDNQQSQKKLTSFINDFFLLFEQRSKKVMQIKHDKIMLILLSIAFLIVFSLFFATYVFYFSRKRLISPLQAIHKGLITLQQGSYNHRIRIDSRDEINDLADIYNTMAASIEKKTDQLLKKQLLLENIFDATKKGCLL